MKKYPMFKEQLAQIDCRFTKCKYYKGAGNCSNISPAITLNEDRTYVCWSKIEKQQIFYNTKEKVIKSYLVNIKLIHKNNTDKGNREIYSKIIWATSFSEVENIVKINWEKLQCNVEIIQISIIK
jgi:hypothetical protein